MHPRDQKTVCEQKPPRTCNKRTPVNRQSGSAGPQSPLNLKVPDPVTRELESAGPLSPANLDFFCGPKWLGVDFPATLWLIFSVKWLNSGSEWLSSGFWSGLSQDPPYSGGLGSDLQPHVQPHACLHVKLTPAPKEVCC